ncbi:hypothetical protein POM88_026314 [Heracleum sosnowskyi]|uniref:Uncharacterized protein n=1 Tax=Heracleum sosnowskyi TaxID=360622 RepID=A0AAD8I8W0_9APIA|nr:hypothetical protein POM88_026314 [Heracleum sosnowskyi]
MDEIGKLETNGDILLMTGLITKEVQYVEVFVVFIELEPLTVEGLPLGNTDISPVIEVDDLTVEEVMQSSESSSTDETEQVHVIKKKKIKSVGRKSTPMKKSGNRPIVGEGGNDGNEGGNEGENEGGNDGGRNADYSGHNADEVGTDGNQSNKDGYEAEYEDHNDGGNEDYDFNLEWMNEPLSDEDDAEWFPDSSNDGNSNFEEDFGDVTSEYKGWNMNDNLYKE